jgi:NAD(P)-dependent dehydrogenase (short-subunit alcohol dehydrogenase family)
MSLDGQVALVAGASRGIGADIARYLAAAGAKVAVAARTTEQKDPRLPGTIHSVVQEITDAGGEAFPVVINMRDPESIASAVQEVVDTAGRLDILVNNAAVTQIKAVDTLSDKDIDIMIDTNLKGYIKCAREAVRLMKESGTKGSLLFISSKNGLVGASNKSLYCASKGGELALARALAKELGVFGIRVNTICPDAVLEGSGLWEDDDYRLGTARRYGISEEEIPDYYKERCALKTNIQPEDIANAALFLVSNKAAKITGAILTVDGGVAFVR